MSDRDVGAATLEERADDIRTFMAAAGSEKAAIFGISKGDGILATFDGPSRAIACADAIQVAAEKLGPKLRAGVHTGECLRSGKM
jgi:class 3 adenylate cyclase